MNAGVSGLDVVTHAALSLSISAKRYGCEGRSHSLWYCDPFEEDRFGWYEVAFMHSPLFQRTSSMAPFACRRGQMPRERCFPAWTLCTWPGPSLG